MHQIKIPFKIPFNLKSLFFYELVYQGVTKNQKNIHRQEAVLTYQPGIEFLSLEGTWKGINNILTSLRWLQQERIITFISFVITELKYTDKYYSQLSKYF